MYQRWTTCMSDYSSISPQKSTLVCTSQGRLVDSLVSCSWLQRLSVNQMETISSPLPLKPGTHYQNYPSTVEVQRYLNQSVQICCAALWIIIQGLPGMCKVANTKLADCSSKDHCTQWKRVLNKTVGIRTCHACKARGHRDKKSVRCV